VVMLGWHRPVMAGAQRLRRDAPSSPATGTVFPLERKSRTASRLNSGGYAGLVLATSTPFRGPRRSGSRCQQNRVKPKLKVKIEALAAEIQSGVQHARASLRLFEDARSMTPREALLHRIP
jgi:hypothetical protein